MVDATEAHRLEVARVLRAGATRIGIVSRPAPSDDVAGRRPATGDAIILGIRGVTAGLERHVRDSFLRLGRRGSTGLLVPTGGLVVAGMLWLAIVVFSVLDIRSVPPFMQDAYAYWVVPAGDPYRGAIVGEPGAYLYSPAFLLLMTPLRVLPWPAFVAVWAAILLGAAAYLGGPRLLALAVVLSAPEIVGGNITLLLGVAVVLGFRWPWTWSFVLLSKLTPGIGLLWFAVRRQWGELFVAAVATALIVGLSYAISPGAWLDWIGVLDRNAGATGTWAAIQIPLAIRLPVAIAVIIWAARGDRRWALPIGCLLAMPVIWYGSLTFLLASVALLPRSVIDRVRATFPRGAADAAGAV